MEQYPDNRQNELPSHLSRQQMNHNRHGGSLDIQATPLKSISPGRKPAVQRRVNIIEADLQNIKAAPLHIRSSHLPTISS